MVDIDSHTGTYPNVSDISLDYILIDNFLQSVLASYSSTNIAEQTDSTAMEVALKRYPGSLKFSSSSFKFIHTNIGITNVSE
jgi:hypothetical protein